jgi:hypothetical protein
MGVLPKFVGEPKWWIEIKPLKNSEQAAKAYTIAVYFFIFCFFVGGMLIALNKAFGIVWLVAAIIFSDSINYYKKRHVELVKEEGGK